jgi:hypothetical protein
VEFKPQASRSLTIFSFQGALVTGSSYSSIPEPKVDKMKIKNRLKSSHIKDFKSGDTLLETAKAANPCGIRNAAPKMNQPQKTPTGCHHQAKKIELSRSCSPPMRSTLPWQQAQRE